MSVGTSPAAIGAPIDWLTPLRDPALDPGAVLAGIPACAADFRSELRATGTPDLVDTYDLLTLPYPTRFGLWRASRSPAPFLASRWTNPGTSPTFVHERITHRAGTDQPRERRS